MSTPAIPRQMQSWAQLACYACSRSGLNWLLAPCKAAETIFSDEGKSVTDSKR